MRCHHRLRDRGEGAVKAVEWSEERESTVGRYVCDKPLLETVLGVEGWMVSRISSRSYGLWTHPEASRRSRV